MRAFFVLFLVVGCMEEADLSTVDENQAAYQRFVGEFAERVCDEAAVCDPENQLYYCELGYEQVDHYCPGFDAVAARDCLDGRWYCDPYLAWPTACIDVCGGHDTGAGGGIDF